MGIGAGQELLLDYGSYDVTLPLSGLAGAAPTGQLTMTQFGVKNHEAKVADGVQGPKAAADPVPKSGSDAKPAEPKAAADPVPKSGSDAKPAEPKAAAVPMPKSGSDAKPAEPKAAAAPKPKSGGEVKAAHAVQPRPLAEGGGELPFADWQLAEWGEKATYLLAGGRGDVQCLVL